MRRSRSRCSRDTTSITQFRVSRRRSRLGSGDINCLAFLFLAILQQDKQADPRLICEKVENVTDWLNVCLGWKEQNLHQIVVTGRVAKEHLLPV